MTFARAALAAAFLLLPSCGSDDRPSGGATGSGGTPSVPQTCGPAGQPAIEGPGAADPGDHAGASGAGGAGAESGGACLIGGFDAPLGFASMTDAFAKDFAFTSLGREVLLADLDRDGTLDAVVAGATEDYAYGGSYVATLKGNGDGTFRVLGDQLTSAPGYLLIAVGDVNGDGFPDVVSAGRLTGEAELFLGAGDGTLVRSAGVTLPAPTGQVMESLTLGDFNRDGRLDILTEFAILLGHGDGTFDEGVENTGGFLADLDGDHRLDGVRFSDKGMAVSLQLCDGSFGRPVVYPIGASVTEWLLTDLDASGTLDLVTTDSMGDVTLLRGGGDGTFAPAEVMASDPLLTTEQVFPSRPAGGRLLATDADQDGVVDLLVVRTDVVLLRGLGGGALGPPAALRGGSAPESLAVGDVNRDGHPDFVVGEWTYEPGFDIDVSVMLGKAGGAYTPVKRVTESISELLSVTAGDLNGDGHPDLCEAYLQDNGKDAVQVRLGQDDGTFGEPTAYPVPPVSLAARLADLDGDGKLDWIAPGCNGDGVSVLLGLGDGTFAAAGKIPLVRTCGGAEAYGTLDLGDLDDDGHVDAVVTNPTLGSVGVFLGDGAGGFSAPVSFSVAGNPYAVLVRDLNGDGELDAITADPTGTLAVLVGDGSGSLGEPTLIALLGRPLALAAADFDGDGLLDLAVTLEEADGVAILRGKAGGRFENPVTYPVHRYPTSLAVGDLNADGTLDLAVGSLISTSVLYGAGDGTFRATESYGIRGAGPAVQILDLNGDERADLLLPSQFSWVDEVFGNAPRSCQ